MKFTGSNINLENVLGSIRTYQKYIYLLVVALVGIQLYFTLVQPKLNEGRFKKRQLADFSKILSNKKSKALYKGQIDNEVQRLTLNLATMEKALFTSQEFNSFYISGLGLLATKTNLKLDSINVVKGVSTIPEINLMTLSLSIKGGFAEFISFLNILETHHKTINIQNITFSRISADPVILGGKIQLTLFVRPTVEPAPEKGAGL